MQRGTIAVRLKPRAGRNAIERVENGTFTVAVTSPPVDNKANEQCISLLAKKLGCRKQDLCIIKGEHCRDKVIACEDLSSDEIVRKLLAAH